MAVEYTCFLYNANIATWQKCRDVVNGEDFVKRAGESYLPKPDSMDEKEYANYLLRAEFFNATGRTLDGLHGLVFRNNPIVTVTGGEEYLQNVDRRGSTFAQFASDVCYDIMQTGWGGILIDAPETKGMSLKEANETRSYPYLISYRAEDIVNWHYKTEGRFQALDLVVLKEDYVTLDGFSENVSTRYRVLDIRDGVYKQTVFENGEVVSEAYPTKFGKPLTYIPFYFMPSKLPEKPMLLDLVNVNLAWYRKSADYESGLHYVSIPTPYTIGWSPMDGEPKVIKLSSASFIHFPDTVQQVGMLEFSGSGMSAMREAMNNDEERMAILGARIISAEKKGIEAVDTAKIHRAGENSVLATFANNISNVLSLVVKDYIEWCSAQEIEATVQLNTDFDTTSLSAQDLTAFVSAWQNGALSREQLHKNLQKGEIIDSDLTLDDMLNEMERE